MRPIRTLTALAALTFVGLATVACNALTDEGDAADVAGSYTLASVDGNQLPHEISDGTGSLIINSGTLTLTEGGSYTTSITGQDTVGSETWTDTFSGTYTVDGSGIVLIQADDFYPQPGAVSTDAVTIPLANGPAGEVTWNFRFERNNSTGPDSSG